MKISEKTYRICAAVLVLAMLLTICLDIVAVLIPYDPDNKGPMITALDVLKQGPAVVYPGPLISTLTLMLGLVHAPYAMLPLVLFFLAAPVAFLLFLGVGRGARIQLSVLSVIVILSVGSELFSRRTSGPLLDVLIGRVAKEAGMTLPR